MVSMLCRGEFSGCVYQLNCLIHDARLTDSTDEPLRPTTVGR